MRRFALTLAVMGFVFSGAFSPSGESPGSTTKIPGRFEAELTRSVALAGGGDQKILPRFFSRGGSPGLTVPPDMIGSLEYGVDSLTPFF